MSLHQNNRRKVQTILFPLAAISANQNDAKVESTELWEGGTLNWPFLWGVKLYMCYKILTKWTLLQILIWKNQKKIIFFCRL